MRINEYQFEEPPEDHFKRNRVLKLKKKEVAQKITNLEREVKESI